MDNQVDGKIAVGECESCHRQLRVKAHAVKKIMRLTCKCGYANTICAASGALEKIKKK